VRMPSRPSSATRFFAQAICSGVLTVAAPCWRKQVTSTMVPRIVVGAMRLVMGPWAESVAAETSNAARLASIIFVGRYLRLYARPRCGVKNSARLRCFREDFR